MPERLTGKHVADVQLHQRYASALDRVMQRHAGMGIGARIEHHTGQLPRCMQPPRMVDGVDQFALVVALAEIKLPAMARARLQAQRLHIGQGGLAIHRRFARAQQVEIGTVENADSQRTWRRRVGNHDSTCSY